MRARQLLPETSAVRWHATGARAALSNCALVTVLLAICLLCGCSILEVIDGLGGGEAAAEEQVGDSCERGDPGAACPSGSGNWWANAKTLSSDAMETDIVSCRIGDASRFTSRQSCLARAGTPSG